MNSLLLLLAIFVHSGNVLFTVDTSDRTFLHTDETKIIISEKGTQQLPFLSITSAPSLGVIAFHKYGAPYTKDDFFGEWDKGKRFKINKKSVVFTFITALADEFMWALTKTGIVYRCLRINDCTSHNNWELGPRPPQRELPQTENEKRMKMAKKVEGKFIEIAAQNHEVYGVCKTGALFKFEGSTWVKQDIAFQVKSASVSIDDELYIVTNEGMIKKRKTDSEWIQISDVTDFEKVAVINSDVYAVNYYKQLFRLDDGEWNFLEEDVANLFVGDDVSARRRFQEHTEL